MSRLLRLHNWKKEIADIYRKKYYKKIFQI